eukprot:CAMPEP_0202340534 /NCGR_PEP_ID=MMETSP1126-20121109/1933_1 /ASSEMBLY_ACC=CAM_ASM_000457 /TAXON_ID=3047 /ORGANISM="Dunaliella tertiolecta, Strain CCMP1320" /LENGTH=57 /DNA_ID=CAMNT_0048931255 /DNA_START=468 /DNA_END=641 /DNA_ORIENTATION=+
MREDILQWSGLSRGKDDLAIVRLIHHPRPLRFNAAQQGDRASQLIDVVVTRDEGAEA